ncbi:hypothetical protein GIW05_00635 [Pseudomonas syringae]|uniref:hypothetical protein n=1 Tax=Pseudomonas syringae TaxID=317 RepID=UPI001F321EE7|nr:hypothetical protein [Pseudomonas syringae]MCF5382027.1 hypothetical protein [Pseudomonas syringae]MCF5419440.1 hypothetical protein [Pseudomonas syringae]MCF5451986.1 hypothetical protein [Pseudomonas syringae]MCF5456273.1 hypothetical protein [Pseudomonas syringae]
MESLKPICKTPSAGGVKVEPVLAGPTAHEMTFEQFSSQATVTALVSHGRQWQVDLEGSFISFAEGRTPEDALRQAHSNEVNNALYFNTPGAPVIDCKPSMPPQAVLAQYPDVVALFPEVGLATGITGALSAPRTTGQQLSMSL